jgi:hypothetical protein
VKSYLPSHPHGTFVRLRIIYTTGCLKAGNSCGIKAWTA